MNLNRETWLMRAHIAQTCLGFRRNSCLSLVLREWHPYKHGHKCYIQFLKCVSTFCTCFNNILCWYICLGSKEMEFFFRTQTEETSDCSFNGQDIQRCPFLSNINKPTNFSFFSALNFPSPVSYFFLNFIVGGSSEYGYPCAVVLFKHKDTTFLQY